MILKVYAILSTGLNILLFLAFLHTRKEMIKTQQALGVFWRKAIERRREKKEPRNKA